MEDILKYIAGSIAAEEKALGLNWRYSYSLIKPVEKGIVEVELSRKEVMRGLIDRLEGFSVESGKEGVTLLGSPAGATVRLRLLGSGGDTVLWVVSSVADIRRDPAHSAELLDQAIMGEEALSLKIEGEWHLVCMADDYHGWISSWFVSETAVDEVESYRRRTNRMVQASIGYVLSEPDDGSLPVSDVVAGTKVIAGEPVGGFVSVALPGGRRGYIREGVLGEPAQGKPDRTRLVRRAKRFLGIPYVWGGASAKGFDCSGFVKRVFLFEGVELPRDSDRQAEAGRLIPRNEIDRAFPGDLLFFGEGGVITHVAIYLGNGRFIHAYGDVRINSFLADDPIYEGKLAKVLLFARSILPE
ncbi:MAG: C40 family peptidase [Candidatus Krumholzibacteria bacterium]|nr:C40 family peptidase [Candidatus Krumholzibacteria bacterium]